jgi:signal transduction histidine kinase
MALDIASTFPMFNRSRRNLAYWFALSMGGILIAFASVIYWREVDSQLQTFDQSLYKRSKTIAQQTRYRFQQGQWRIDLADISLQGNQGLPLSGDLAYLRWYNAQGNLVQFMGASAPKQLTVKPGMQTLKTEPPQMGENTATPWLRQLTVMVMQERSQMGYLQIAAPLTPLQDSLDKTRLFLALGVPVTLGVIGLAGWTLGGLAMKPIRQSYQQLQRFTADASHELRAPLAAILSNAQVGLLAPPEETAQQRQRLENIVAITKSMSDLVGNLLFLSRHEGALAASTLSQVDLVQLLYPLAENYATQAATQNLIFTSQLPARSLLVQVEPNLFRQAVVNLLNNACQYTPTGGKVHLCVSVQPHRVVIQVTDSGIGIPATDLPHIFERFYRVDAARSRQSGGFGLGLSIAQQIVQAHGGRITAQSVVGQGTTFQIELPLPSMR